MHMRVREIKELIQAVSESDITEFTLEDEAGFTLVLRKTQPETVVASPQVAIQSTVPVAAPAAPVVQAEPEAEENSFDDPRFETITAPMVGTFYRAPAPDAPPYVNVGDDVIQGQALCIIEAMKLMNEIESEVKGRIVKILVENAEPVEYGQPLFVVEKE